MPQLDPTFFASQVFWLALTFIPLVVVIWTALLPKIRGVVEGRDQRIAGDLDRAAAAKAEAAHLLATYEKTLAAARSEAQALLRTAGEKLAADAAKRQAELGTRLAAQVKEAETRIDKAKLDALANIRTVAAEVARSATTRLGGTEPSADRVEKAVAAALKERG